jgi:hypothetical protein
MSGVHKKNLTFGRRTSQAGEALSDRVPAPAAAEHEPRSARGLSLPGWQRERARRLHSICQRIEGRVQRGEAVRRAVRLFSWRNRPLQRKSWRLSRGRLRTLFYQWRRNPTPAAFQLHYKPGRAVPRALIDDVLRRCQAADVFSLAQAVQSLKRDLESGGAIRDFGTLRDWLREHLSARKNRSVRLPYLESSFYRVLGSQERRALSALFRARQRVQRDAKTLARVIQRRAGR